MSKKTIFPLLFYSLIIAIGLLFIVVYQKITFEDGKLHIVFCDVDQGDAIFIRTPGGTDILVDGGPDERVLSCLGKHMPFWDRTLEMVILTHSHADHFTGLISVIKRYHLIQFFDAGFGAETEGARQLKSEIKKKKTPALVVKANDKFKIKANTREEATLTVLWPPEDLTSSDINDLSIVFLLSWARFEALLTGDAGINAGYQKTFEGEVDVLKIPHHGSRTGLDREFLERIRPQVAVISVGKNNRFGHPHEEIIKILRDKAISILRTDQDGEIEIISDGEKWWVKN